jgi:thioredoxin 2
MLRPHEKALCWLNSRSKGGQRFRVNQDSIIIRCGNCGMKNRIPKTRLRDKPVCGKCRTPLASGGSWDHPVTVTDSTFREGVLSYPGTVIVDCWAPWCGPCHMLSPTLEHLASEYAGRLKVTKLNVDENPTIASQYAIQSIPTLLIFKDGKLANRLVGALPKEEIERHLSPFL